MPPVQGWDCEPDLARGQGWGDVAHLLGGLEVTQEVSGLLSSKGVKDVGFGNGRYRFESQVGHVPARVGLGSHSSHLPETQFLHREDGDSGMFL